MSLDPLNGPLASEIVLRLLDGVPPDVLRRAARDRGAAAVIEGAARRQRARAERARRSADHALWIERRHRELQRDATTLEAVDRVGGDAFYDRFYLQNRPLLIRDFREPATPPFRWTLDAVNEALPDAMVLVQRGRSVQPYFAPHPARRAALEPLGAFIREIQAGPSADCYVTADCGAIGGGLSLVVRDVFPPSGILRIPRSGEASLWLGPAGAYTPLHYDDGNVAIAQLIGRKRIHLIPPHDYPLVAASSDGPYAEFDPERPDFKQYPLARFATVLTAEIEAGSALFVPAGWWHAVKSLTPTLSVSYASFHLPNVYPALENL